MLTSPSRDHRSASHIPELTHQLLRRGVRLSALLRVSAAGLAHAPTLDERSSAVERARERLLQLERAADRYAELNGADLLADAELLLTPFEAPSSWPEASFAQLILCLSAQVELEAAPRADDAVDALACETEHSNAARAALRELGELGAALRGRLQDAMPRWLSIAYATLDPEHGAAFTRALDAVLQPMKFHFKH